MKKISDEQKVRTATKVKVADKVPFLVALLNRLKYFFSKLFGCGRKVTVSREEAMLESLQIAQAVLQSIDQALQQEKYSRTFRKSFWDGFRKEGRVRAEIFQDLLNEKKLEETIQRVIRKKVREARGK